MSRAVGTPVNQVRHTNVAIVRLKKKGKHFEIACYRNKVVSWRNKVETDLDEVLQIDNIFTNVSKGMLANSKDIVNCFDTDDNKLVIKEILEKGELQVTDQERQAMQDSMFKDVAAIVAEKCMNPENNRAYTVSMIQSAMKQIHYGVNLTKSAKSQALDTIKKLKAVMPLARAPMSLRIVYPSNLAQRVREELEGIRGIVVDTLTFENTGGGGVTPPAPPSTQQSNNSTEEEPPLPAASEGGAVSSSQACRFHTDPDSYRCIQDCVKKLADSRAYVEVLALNALAAGGAVAGAASSVTTAAAAAAAAAAAEEEGIVLKLSPDEEYKVEQEFSAENIVIKQRQEDNDSEEDIVAEGMVTSGLKKKKKDKKKAKLLRKQTQEQLSEGDDSDGDSDTEPVDGNESVAASEASASTSATAATDSSNNNSNKGGKKDTTNKLGKKSKRAEKARVLEEKAQLEAISGRLEKEKKRAEERLIAAAAAAAAAAAGTDVGAAAAATATTPAGNTTAGDCKACTTCGGSFDKLAYREHFRSEWHRFNLKRKMDGGDILNEEDFLALSLSQMKAK
jgi:ribosome maturation protein SDO1